MQDYFAELIANFACSNVAADRAETIPATMDPQLYGWWIIVTEVQRSAIAAFIEAPRSFYQAGLP